MRKELTVGTASVWLAVLAACSDPSAVDENKISPTSTALPPADRIAEAQIDRPVSATAGSAAKPGGGLVAEPSEVDAHLSIVIRWSAQIVTGIPAEGLTTTVYKRTAQLECPVRSGDETSYSYFAAMDNPNGDPMAATGSYQPWWNEDCTGSLTIDDTYHADDPTLAGPEPVVHTTGTRPLSTADTPLTVETDLNRARTRYLFITPSTDGFQQEAVKGYEAKLVAASAAPMATMDFTLEGPIGDGKREVAVQGGKLWVDWTFKRSSGSE